MQTAQKMLLDSRSYFEPMAWKWKDLFDNDVDECRQEIFKDILEISLGYQERENKLPDVHYLRRAVYNKMLLKIRKKSRLKARKVEPIWLLDELELDRAKAVEDTASEEIDVSEAFEVLKSKSPKWLWELVDLRSKCKMPLRQAISLILVGYPELDPKGIKQGIKDVIKDSYDCGLELVSNGFAILFRKLGV